MGTATATLVGYNGYNSGWYRSNTALKTDFYNDSWGRTEYNGIAHEFAAGDYCYVIAFKLPKGTYNRSSLTMCNLGYAKPWSSAGSSRSCDWAITDTGPAAGTKALQGTTLLSGTISVSNLNYVWNTASEAYIQYPSSYTTTSTSLFTVTNSEKYYYFWLYGGNAVRAGFRSPTIQFNNYTPLNYTVSYNSNGANSGSVPSSQSKTHGVDLTLQTNSGNLAYTNTEISATYTATFDSNGGNACDKLTANKIKSWSADKWNTKSDGTGTDYAFGGTYNTDANITLYLKWGIHYNTEQITLPSTSRSGYGSFVWKSGVTEYNAGDTVTLTSNTTFTAEWSPNSYTVNYDANGGTGTMSASSATYGVGFMTDRNKFTRKGYIFNGWNEKADGTGNAWSLNSKGVKESGKNLTWNYTNDITLYAQWEPIEYTINYHLNNGNTTYSTTQKVNYDSNFNVIPSNSINRDKYIFEGWTTNSNGSPDNYNWTAYSGKWIHISGEYGIVNNVLNLYAMWSRSKFEIHYHIYDDFEYVAAPIAFNETLLTINKIPNARIYDYHKFNCWTDGNGSNIDWTLLDGIDKNGNPRKCHVYASFTSRYKIVYRDINNWRKLNPIIYDKEWKKLNAAIFKK